MFLFFKMRFVIQFITQIGILLPFEYSNGLIINPSSISSSPPNPPVPQYRFYYSVHDEKTGDYKSQEEHRTGDSVTGSYMVADPNGDLRHVKYVADASSGFVADVSVQPGGSPIKSSINLPKESVTGYNNQRTGISAPPKYRKPLRGYNPIVVKSFSQQPQIKAALLTSTFVPNYSYSFYKENTESTQNAIMDFTTTVIPQKSVQVDLTYRDDSAIEKTQESVILPEKKKFETSSTLAPTTTGNKNFDLQSLSHLSTEMPTSKVSLTENSFHPSTSSFINGLYHFDNMDIPSSIMEILNQQKANLKNPSDSSISHFSDISTTPVTSEFPVQTKSSVLTELGLDEQKKISLPQRPMRLIGLSPIYMDHTQLQAINENLTAVPQAHLESIGSIQYATPTPFLSSSLLGGPGPFRNIPRSVSENSESLPNIVSSSNILPLMNSLPISAPIVQPAETKQDNKLTPPPPSLPLCNDCLLSPNYMSYPVMSMRFPAVNNNNKNNNNNNNNNQKPCHSENTPYWAPYKPGFAYILMPSQIIKNNF